MSSGEVIGLEGTDIEIEVTFNPEDQRLFGPTLLSLRILVLTEAEIDGFSIDTEAEFNRGTSQNITVTSSAVLSLTEPVFVDSYYFALGNSINQVHEKTDTAATPFTEGELGLFGNASPVAPNQVFKAVEENGLRARVSTGKLFEARSVRRQFNRTFIVADTYNDRILQFEEDGTLVSGFGSINYEIGGTSVFPIAASVDTRTNILYLVWNRKISFETVNISKIKISTIAQQVQLIKDFDKILGLSTSELITANAEGQIMPVHLSDQNAALISNLPATETFILASKDATTNGIDQDSVFYKTIITGIGIPCFIGKFAYIDGVFSPTWAEKNNDDNVVVCNSTIAIKDYVFPSEVSESISLSTNASSIIEVDGNNNIVFGSNVMNFSPFIPGRADPLDDNLVLIGGIKPGGEEGNPEGESKLNFRSLSGDKTTQQAQMVTLNDIFFGAGTPFVGAVVVLDKSSNSTVFEYTSSEGVLVSDVDVDASGQYVVAESSFQKSGRIIKLDAVGNVVFSTGQGEYSLINDISVQLDDSIVIST